MPKPIPTTIDAYLAELPAPAAAALAELRALVHAEAPGVTERISYGMPTFDLDGAVLIYFAAWKKHIGLYPMTGRVAAALADELRGYVMGRGSLQLPLATGMPLELVRTIVRLRIAEVRRTE